MAFIRYYTRFSLCSVLFLSGYACLYGAIFLNAPIGENLLNSGTSFVEAVKLLLRDLLMTPSGLYALPMLGGLSIATTYILLRPLSPDKEDEIDIPEQIGIELVAFLIEVSFTQIIMRVIYFVGVLGLIVAGLYLIPGSRSAKHHLILLVWNPYFQLSILFLGAIGAVIGPELYTEFQMRGRGKLADIKMASRLDEPLESDLDDIL